MKLSKKARSHLTPTRNKAGQKHSNVAAETDHITTEDLPATKCFYQCDLYMTASVPRSNLRAPPNFFKLVILQLFLLTLYTPTSNMIYTNKPVFAHVGNCSCRIAHRHQCLHSGVTSGPRVRFVVVSVCFFYLPFISESLFPMMHLCLVRFITINQ